MTRKDYIAIAEGLRNAVDYHGATREVEDVIMTAAESIASAMQVDNPRFDREHFLAVVRGERDLNSRPARKVA
ncbi:MAG: hypothetical protein ACREBG_09775 [Pyrinomonadaceae bacterium]